MWISALFLNITAQTINLLRVNYFCIDATVNNVQLLLYI